MMARHAAITKAGFWDNRKVCALHFTDGREPAEGWKFADADCELEDVCGLTDDCKLEGVCGLTDDCELEGVCGLTDDCEFMAGDGIRSRTRARREAGAVMLL